jgi:hypothetical protein
MVISCWLLVVSPLKWGAKKRKLFESAKFLTGLFHQPFPLKRGKKALAAVQQIGLKPGDAQN